ncbi:MAG TPA: TonB family protein [Gemmatimonadaceae bacterium]|nr:TonB family protein [Gemmatimonadaceae bacterium]
MRLALLPIILLASCASPKQEVVFVEAKPTAPQPAAQANPEQTYFEFQVEKPATPRATNAPPVYPPELRAAGVEGEAIVQFVVDTAGVPEMASFRVLRSTHSEFTKAAHAHVSTARYNPAMLRGRKVRQLVQQPFNFQIRR